MKIYTSDDLAGMDLEEFESITEQCEIRYRLTEGERGWLDWIGDRYSISAYLFSVLSDDDHPTENPGIITINACDVSDALDDDGVDRAPCLSDETQLQRLIWYIGP